MAKKTSNSKLVKVRADSLKVHPFAQRDLVPSKLKRLAADMDLDAIGVLHGVEYSIKGHGEGIYIIDGQHRLMALMELGLGEWIVEVKVHLDADTNARASELFLKLNDRSPVHPYDKFTNAVRAGDEAAVGIQELATRRNLSISRSAGAAKLTCVSSLRNAWGLDSGKTLERTLDITVQGWGTKPAALEGKLIEGIAHVVCRYNGVLDRIAFVSKLSKYPGGPAGLIGDAKGRRQYTKASLPRCIAAVVIESYNSGRRAGKLDPI